MVDLWKEVTAETALPGAVRTSILNLVIYAGSAERAERLKKELAGQPRRHGSRTILLIADRDRPGSSVDAASSVRCSASQPDSPPLCYEEITITGVGKVADHLASVVVPLLVAELPTFLWWPGQPPFGHRLFNQMLGVADQLLIDSSHFDSPGDGLAHLARLCRARQGVNDLNWGRLAPWREVIAQFFDGAAWQPYAYGLRSLHLIFGSGTNSARRATATTLLLAGWIGSRLGWTPETTLDSLVSGASTLTVERGDRAIDVTTEFQDAGEKMAGLLIGVELVSQPKGLAPARFAVKRLEDMEHACSTMNVHDGVQLQRVVPLHIETDAELLSQELEQSGHDTLYESVVGVASQLAGREVWVPS
ncbi:MAG TPA: glucose-6-phosphate dehydrogenase assembly protein OpcA [Chloroflexota bacterium]|nr:glucose-6-phosphate dehydrogenase assembly protein OpcA [Chloroflexota bacterium]